MSQQEKIEEDAMCETYDLFTDFNGFDRDHYADQKKESFQIDLCGQDIRISQVILMLPHNFKFF